MPLTSSSPIFVRNALNVLAMSNLFVIAMAFVLRDVGNGLLLPFFERVSLMVFRVFLISDLYLSNINANNCCLAADMLRLRILLNVLRLMLNISYSLQPGLVNFTFLYYYYYKAFITRHSSGLKTCSEALTTHSVHKSKHKKT